jgi:hypothetical protein
MDTLIDGKYALQMVFTGVDQGTRVDLLELGPSVEILARKRLGLRLRKYMERGEQGAKTAYLLIKDTGDRMRYFRLNGAGLEEFRLLPDETNVREISGAFAVTLLSNGAMRVREFGSPDPLFETGAGDVLSLVGVRGAGKELRAVLVSHGGAEARQSLYELAQPEHPLLTGRFWALPPQREDTMVFFSSDDPIVKTRGLVVPVGAGRKLWIDDEATAQ